MNVRFSLLGLLTLGQLLLLSPMAWGSQQSQFEMIGVAKDLSLLGMSQTWTDEATGLKQCEVSIYEKNRWSVSQARTVTSNGLEATEFEQACDALQTKARKKFALYKITWDLTPLTPAPGSVKDKAGRVQDNPELLTQYPALQHADFTLPENALWQAIVRSEKPETIPTRYTLVLRNPDEPTPYRSIQGEYTNGSLLFTPVRVMTNNHYGLVTVLFRETRQGKNGLDYFYHPYFIHWPEYSPLSVEQARDHLIQAADYAMEPDELVKGPNSSHPSYRSYLRLKTAGLSQEDIETYLDRSSPAGKLYWLSLLHTAYPKRYAFIAKSILKETPKTTEVIEVTGRDWQSVPFETELENQMQAYLKP